MNINEVVVRHLPKEKGTAEETKNNEESNGLIEEKNTDDPVTSKLIQKKFSARTNSESSVNETKNNNNTLDDCLREFNRLVRSLPYFAIIATIFMAISYAVNVIWFMGYTPGIETKQIDFYKDVIESYFFASFYLIVVFERRGYSWSVFYCALFTTLVIFSQSKEGVKTIDQAFFTLFIKLMVLIWIKFEIYRIVLEEFFNDYCS